MYIYILYTYVVHRFVPCVDVWYHVCKDTMYVYMVACAYMYVWSYISFHVRTVYVSGTMQMFDTMQSLYISQVTCVYVYYLVCMYGTVYVCMYAAKYVLIT